MPIVTTRRMIEKEEALKRYAQQKQEIEKIQGELSLEYGISKETRKFKKCWALAWSYGHSAGYEEVVNHFRDFVELILEEGKVK